jgi:hypothetical protein
VFTKYPLPATAENVDVFISDVCQSIAPKPVAVPLFDNVPVTFAVPAIVSVAPDGNVTVSPESDICRAVPVAGDTLFTLISDAIMISC